MSMDFGRGVLFAAIVLRATCGPSLAAAASAESRALARQELNRAHAAKKSGKLAEACQHLTEVERLDPKLPTLIELAECTEELGRLVEAQALWASARERAKHDEKPQSRARAESRLAALKKRVAQLTLQLAPGTPAAVQVLRDDRPIDPTQLGTALPIDPGPHSIVVKLAGHDDAKYPLTLGDGDDRTLAIGPGPVSSAAPAPVPLAPPPSPVAAPLSPATPGVVAQPSAPAAPRSTGFWTAPRTAGVIAGASGVAAVAGGSVLCLTGDSGTADPKLALGGASLAVGGVLLVSGLVMLATSSRDEAAEHARLRVAPTLSVGSGATLVGASGRF
jgi:hypothetical protein